MATTSLFEDTNPHELKELLGLIHSRELALPDFQRDFVWEPVATQELIISIANGFPAGSILRIRNTQDLFKARAFDGAPPLNGKRPTYLVLDGQQRLTSLYQAFYGTGEHQFFINLKVLLDTGDFEDAIFHIRTDHRRAAEYLTLEAQTSRLLLPLRVIFGEKDGFLGWVMRMADAVADHTKSKELRDNLRRAGVWESAIDDYKFPVVTLSEQTKAEAVCTIFETLNRTGVKLSVFELLTARFWAQELNLRELWDRALEENPLIEQFDPDPYYLLQIAALLRTDVAASCKRSDVLKLPVTHVSKSWPDVVWGLNEALTILKEDCGVWLPHWLPYTAMLIPIAALMARTRSMKGPEVAAARQKVVRWYWCSVFGQAYENAPNSQSALDVREVDQWVRGGAVPKTVREFRFDPQVLRRTTPRQRALYRGAMALVMKQSPRDFHKGKKLDGGIILKGEADDHHLFPAAYLNRHKVEERVRDSILNRTLIDRETNIRISARPPSHYLKDIRDQLSNALSDVLQSHLLPHALDGTNPLIRDELEPFLSARLELFTREIRSATGAVVRDGLLTSTEWTGAPTPVAPPEDDDDDAEGDDEEGQPWLADGKAWHQKKCSARTWQALEKLLATITEHGGKPAFDWNIKGYVRVSVLGYRWAQVNTYPNQLMLTLWTETSCFEQAVLEKLLRVRRFDTKMGGSEKMGLPSSIEVVGPRGGYYRVRLRIKDDFDFANPEVGTMIATWRETLG